MCEYITFYLIIIVSALNIYFSLDPSRKGLKDRVIPSLNLPGKSMQRRIFKPRLTNTSFFSSSGSKLFTSSSAQSEEKPKNCYKILKNFVNEHVT